MRYLSIPVITLAMLHSVASGGDPKEALDAAANGYFAYCEGINAFSCEFHVDIGNSPNAAAAIKQGPQAVEIRAIGRWSRDKQNEVYELARGITDTERPAEALGMLAAGNVAGKQIPGVRLPPEQFMQTKTHVLHLSGVLGGGRVTSRAREGDTPGPDVTPLNLAGLMGEGARLNPGSIVMQLKDNPHTANGLTMQDTDSADIVRISARTPRVMQYLCEVDRSRGFLCVEMCVGQVDDLPKSRAVVTDSMEIAPGKWFPTRVVHLTRLGPTWDDEVDCVALLVDSVKASADEGELQLLLAEGTLLHDGVNAATQTKLRGPWVVSCAALEGISKRIEGQK